MTYDGWKILVSFSLGDIMDINPDTYQEKLREAIEKAYPGAMVRVMMTQGCGTTLVEAPDERDTTNEVEKISDIDESVFLYLCGGAP